MKTPARISSRATQAKASELAARWRRTGYTHEEIARKLHMDIADVKEIIAEHLPRYLTDSKQWHTARRVRMLSRQERDDCGPQTFRARAKSVLEAQGAGDMNVLIGSLEDLCSASFAWIDRLERQKGQLIPS